MGEITASRRRKEDIENYGDPLSEASLHEALTTIREKTSAIPSPPSPIEMRRTRDDLPDPSVLAPIPSDSPSVRPMAESKRTHQCPVCGVIFDD